MAVMRKEKKHPRLGHLNLINADKPLTETSEDQPKDHFTFRIESFTQLSDIVSKSGVETYETAFFKKKGYRWKVLMYPNGDEKNGGKGYLSLYVVLEESVSFPVGLKVFADFRFFILDQTRSCYLTIRPFDWKKFDKLNNGYGFPKLISINTFKDASSGYLIDDSCVLGVKVKVWRVVRDKIKANISNLSSYGCSGFRITLKGSQLVDIHKVAFTAGGQNWVLGVYPGWIKGYKNHLSMFLNLSGSQSVLSQVIGWFRRNNNSKLHVKFTLRVIDQLHGKHVERTVCAVYSALNPSWGCSDLVDLGQLSTYFLNNKLIVEVEFSAILRSK